MRALAAGGDRGTGAIGAMDTRVIEWAKHGSRVLFIVPKGTLASTRQRLLEKAGGAWPIGLRLKEG